MSGVVQAGFEIESHGLDFVCGFAISDSSIP